MTGGTTARLFRLNIAVGDIEAVHARAGDPWGNPLCFVEEGTIYAG